jgi:hypothetical protein
MAICQNCGNQTGEGAVFCDQCGARLPPPEAAVPETAPAPAGGSVICPACGAGNVPGEAFCDYCGSPLAAPEPSVEAAPDLEPVSSEAELEVAPEMVEEAPQEVAAEPTPKVEGELTCPACGASVQPDEAFCADCGASLAKAPIPPEPVPEEELEPEPVTEEAPPEPAVGGGGAAPAPAPAPVEVPPPPPPSPAGPRLVVTASGAEIPLPAGEEILIGREDPVSGVYPEIDLTPHGGEEGGVSRKHARIVVEGGNYFVEDLDSTNFTFVNKQKLGPKTRHPVNDGDEIRFGRVALVLRM